LAAEAIENYIAAESWQLDEIEAGISDLEASRTVGHDQVRTWLQSWGKKRERKAPR
jgi:predicted transcriptional regulator